MSIKLSAEDFQKLIRIVQSLPGFANTNARYRLLQDILEGSPRGNDVLYSINLDGDPHGVAVEVIKRLINFGQLTSGHEALSVFLNHILLFKGDADPDAVYIRALFVKYPLDMPASPNPSMTDWHSKDTPTDVQEKIIGENTLFHVNRLEWALAASQTVVHLRIDNKHMGTGFMFSPGLVMTNNHVISSQQEAMATTYTFNYQLNNKDELSSTHIAHAHPNGIFFTNAELDYTVLQVTDAPLLGTKLSLVDKVMEPHTRVAIIQHPGGDVKQISMQNNFVTYADKKVVQYTTSTLPGSSGSPVFNNHFEVVAIHCKGGVLSEPGTNKYYLCNSGTSMVAILNDMRIHQPLIYKQVRRA